MELKFQCYRERGAIVWNERHCLYGEQFFCICKVNIWVSFHHYLGTDLLEPICFAGIQVSIQSGLSRSGGAGVG